ncbi:hypothetical protein GCM10022419_045290 [Nonomuraea rosea]|uniref:Molecular chaperone DnaJ n=1 Tax=Nonomuraea rosea TaxID=638574 RepID=A0ABP6X312_9ACTN
MKMYDPCEECDGFGVLLLTRYDVLGQATQNEIVCNACAGTGVGGQ